ncbi:hypothetical protein M413DRAFT_422909 [Hebeloma cylindrosporum]|uniref:Uncharacterized protein n=1 Tax=Hebeloma cylindrosporum TaxID=76867 RepID=A0A0C2YBF9_HEBCY|nr:hypothetical protein M413DRAFT_422909 [Hebeloma cylindrosporum h7]
MVNDHHHRSQLATCNQTRREQLFTERRHILIRESTVARLAKPPEMKLSNSFQICLGFLLLPLKVSTLPDLQTLATDVIGLNILNCKYFMFKPDVKGCIKWQKPTIEEKHVNSLKPQFCAKISASRTSGICQISIDLWKELEPPAA